MARYQYDDIHRRYFVEPRSTVTISSKFFVILLALAIVGVLAIATVVLVG